MCGVCGRWISVWVRQAVQSVQIDGPDVEGGDARGPVAEAVDSERAVVVRRVAEGALLYGIGRGHHLLGAACGRRRGGLRLGAAAGPGRPSPRRRS